MDNRASWKSEKGALIVEATIVFPVMFFVILFMIFAGNAYWQRCKVEAIVNELALDGAAYCGDLLLYDVENNSIPDVSSYHPTPYAVIGAALGFSTDDSMGEYVEKIKEQLENRLASIGTGLFSGMTPVKISDPEIVYDTCFVYATFAIEVEMEVEIPIPLLGQKDFTVYSITNYTKMPVMDTMEFIRTLDMVQDYADSTGLTQKVTDLIEEVKAKFSKE